MPGHHPEPDERQTCHISIDNPFVRGDMMAGGVSGSYALSSFLLS
jgi:hypothetical protein